MLLDAWGHDQLLPQSLRVLAGELARQHVEVAQALDSDKEGLVVRQSGLGEGRDLVAKVIFQLLDVDGVDRLAAAQVGPPFGDALLQPIPLRVCRHPLRPPGAPYQKP